jgi:hypothetical protein
MDPLWPLRHARIFLSTTIDGQEEQTTAVLAAEVVMALYFCQHACSAIGVPGGYNVAEEKMMSVRCIERVQIPYFLFWTF